MSTDVRRLGPEDWRDWRDLRLRALAESPSAFGSNLAREQGFGEVEWQERATDSFVAYAGGVPVAIGAGTAQDDGLSVVAMWTEPDRRGEGIGGLVLDAIVDLARERGLRARLFVMRANPEAARLYERHGFRRSGLVQEHGGRAAEELVADARGEP